MEKELNIPTTLFGGPPVRDNMIKMGESQIGFMNIFAIPLFESITHILPAMQFSVDELLRNKGVWEKRIEQGKQSAARSLSLTQIDGTPPSPTTRVGSEYFQTSPSEPEIKVAHDSAQSSAPQKVVLHSRIPSSPTSGKASGRSSLDQVINASQSADTPTGETPQSLMASTQPASNGQAISQARRSSKDVALAPLNLSQLGSLTTSDSHNVSSSRRGSADASLTTILVTSKESSADTERPPSDFPAAAASSEKTQSQPILSDASDPAGRTSVPSYPSAHSHAASSNTNTIPHSPSTQATSLFEGDSLATNGESFSTTSPPFPPNGHQTTSVPHLPLGEEVKNGVISPYGPDTVGPIDDNHVLRNRPSRTGLRGLKFWKDLRRWKSPSPVNRTGTNHVP